MLSFFDCWRSGGYFLLVCNSVLITLETLTFILRVDPEAPRHFEIIIETRSEKRMKNDMIYGLLIHLGRNLWGVKNVAVNGDGERGKYLDAVDQLAGAMGKVRRWRERHA